MHAIFVTINIKPGFREQFKEASLGDSQGSVRDEPGCFRFGHPRGQDEPEQVLPVRESMRTRTRT